MTERRAKYKVGTMPEYDPAGYIRAAQQASGPRWAEALLIRLLELHADRLIDYCRLTEFQEREYYALLDWARETIRAATMYGKDCVTGILQDVWDHRTTVRNADTALHAIMRREVLAGIEGWVNCEEET